MGCHTWFYKKEERSIEEARQKLVEALNRVIEAYTIDRESPESYYNHFRNAYNKTHAEMDWLVKVIQRQIGMIEKGLCNVAVMRKQEGVCRYIPEKGLFVDIDGVHDVFRIGGYPDDTLFSLEETLKFIEDQGEKVYAKADNWQELLKYFWEKHPDGMIDFG
jgi:hypothetical protein